MAIDVYLKDGVGNRNRVKVNKYQAAKVYQSAPELAPVGTRNQFNFYRSEFSGMNVNGSVTPVTYTLAANLDVDVFITHIVVVVSASSITHSKFGTIAALTNGFDLKITQDGNDTYFYQAIKTTGQLIVRSGIFDPYGDAASVYDIPNFIGANDGCVVKMSVKEFLPSVYGGIRIGRGSVNTITATVRDNLTSLADFYITFFGFTQNDTPSIRNFE